MKYLIRIKRKGSAYAPDRSSNHERTNLFVAEFKDLSKLIERFKMRNVQRSGAYICSVRFDCLDILSIEAMPYNGMVEEDLFKPYRNVLITSMLLQSVFPE